MNSYQRHNCEVLVACFGGPQGDEQAGGQVVALLARRPNLHARLVTVSESTPLIDELDRCATLIVVEACRGGSRIGAISRLEWPDPRIRQYHNHSAHGVKLCNTLQLAERLGRIPPKVVIFGIDIGYGVLRDEMSPEVVQAVTELEEMIFAEICETVDERTIVSKSTVAAS